MTHEKTTVFYSEKKSIIRKEIVFLNQKQVAHMTANAHYELVRLTFCSWGSRQSVIIWTSQKNYNN